LTGTLKDLLGTQSTYLVSLVFHNMFQSYQKDSFIFYHVPNEGRRCGKACSWEHPTDLHRNKF